MAEKQDLELGDAGKSDSKKKLIIIIAVAVVLLGGGGAAFFLFRGGDAEKAAEAGQAGEAQAETAEAEHEEEPLEEGAPSLLYVGLPEAIIANLPSASKSRTIKLQVSFAVKTPTAEAAVKRHLPLLGSEILMLLSSSTAEQLLTAEGQQAFRDESLKKVQAAMEREERKPMIEKILFTQFVMQ